MTTCARWRGWWRPRRWWPPGLVAVLPQPTALIWQVSVLISEWGYWLAAPALLLLIGWRRSSGHAAAAVLAIGGAALLLSPIAQAVAISRSLPAALIDRFGAPAPPSEFADRARPAPLVGTDLLLGVHSAEVVVDEHVYDVVDGEELRLDLYRPKFAQGALPIVVMIHGGSWMSGDKRDLPALNESLAARDYVVAAITYRLAPRSRFPAPQEDVSAAVAYLKGLTDTHGVDPDRIALVGRSAGGQIALLAGYATDDPAIRGVVSFYGPAALRWGYENPAKEAVVDSSGILETYLGGPPETHGDQYDAAEPARFVTASAPPTLFIQGLRDELVSPFHAEFVSSRLIKEDVPHYILRFPWAAHGCDYVFRGPCGQISTFAVEWFLGAIFRNERPRVAAARAPGLSSR